MYFLGFMYLFLTVGLCCHMWTLVAMSGAALHCGALISHRGSFSLCCGAHALGTRASVVAAHRLSYSEACGICLD